MANSSSSRRLISRHRAASPICSGTIWLAEAQDRQSGGIEAPLQRIGPLEQRRATGGIGRTWRTLASAAAATMGGSEVVKMKPGAVERM